MKTNQQLADEEALTLTRCKGWTPHGSVRVRADGSRSGCSMREANIEELVQRRD